MEFVNDRRPAAVRAAFVMWIVAIGAGAFETVLVVSTGRAGSDALAGVAVRTAVFVAAAFVAGQMLAGRRWARWTLAIGLGVLGTLSLVVDPLLWLADGNSVPDLIVHSGPVDLLFGASRIVHVAAVLTGCALMFAPSATAYFRSARPPAAAFDRTGARPFRPFR